jgi:DNA polymerase-3 subunit gamma/tau
MRDALSVLDQCLSFGEGRVTAERVREVLGLVGDELYAELLGLVAERRPAGVFPLVDRLVNAGADLAEFMNGAGEALRALLMLQLGSEPDGLTDGLKRTLASHRDRLEAGDVLRMLRLLADSETGIRRSSNPRLIVETLLLRWTMLDRMVDLAQVLAAGPRPGRGGPAPAGPSRTPPAAPEAGRAPPELAKPPEGGAAPATPLADRIPAALDAVRDAWPDLVAEVRRQSRFLGEALAATAPSDLELPWVTVELAEPNPLFAERLQAQARAVEEVLERAIGQPARLRVVEATGAPAAAAQIPRKLTEATLRAERLRGFRAKDPSLDTAADALDLEIVD